MGSMLLSGILGGIGKGLSESANIYGNYLANSSLNKERQGAEDLRAQRMYDLESTRAGAAADLTFKRESGMRAQDIASREKQSTAEQAIQREKIGADIKSNESTAEYQKRVAATGETNAATARQAEMDKAKFYNNTALLNTSKMTETERNDSIKGLASEIKIWSDRAKNPLLSIDEKNTIGGHITALSTKLEAVQNGSRGPSEQPPLNKNQRELATINMGEAIDVELKKNPKALTNRKLFLDTIGGVEKAYGPEVASIYEQLWKDKQEGTAIDSLPAGNIQQPGAPSTGQKGSLMNRAGGIINKFQHPDIVDNSFFATRR